MPRDLNHFERDDLVKIIDECGLSTLLDTVALICDDKGQALLANSADNAKASAWDRVGKTLMRFAHETDDVETVSG